MTVSQSIARFIHTLDLDRVPPEVAEKTRVCLLNGYGIGLGCHDTAFAPVARSAAIAMDGEAAATTERVATPRQKTLSPSSVQARPPASLKIKLPAA